MSYKPLIGKRKQRRKADDDDRVMPLINIVFLLLIFFMVVGRLSATDPFRIVPPTSATEENTAEKVPLLLIGAKGQLALDGRIVTEKALVLAVQQTSPKMLRVKTDGRADAVRVVALVDLLRDNGVESIRLLTVRKPEEKS